MIIYKVTNNINGKVYIGLTTQSLKRRIQDHYASIDDDSRFHQALKKYDKECFTWEEIDKTNTIEKLKEKEIYWIEQYDSYDFKKGYNSTLGGDIPWNYGKKYTEKQKINMKKYGDENGFYGKTHTDETKLVLKKHFLTPYEEIKNMFEKENYQLVTEKKDYINTTICIDVICDDGHKWSVRPYVFKRGTRCPICRNLNKRRKYEDIISEFNKYNYIVGTNKEEYENCKSSVNFKFEVICDKGHKSNMLFANFQEGHRCLKCKHIERGKNNKGNKNPMYKNIDEKTKQKIIKLHEEGNSMLSISREINISNNTIKRRLIEWGALSY